MGCCSNVHFEDIIEKIMSQFFFRKIRHDFTVSHIEEYLHTPVKTYYEFLTLTKILGIHSDLNFQTTFWEQCYVTHIDKYGIDGILFLPLFLCSGDIMIKLDYIKEYLSVNINHSKEYNSSTLIMTVNDFQNILFTYFSCLTTIAFNSYNNINRIEEGISDPANVNTEKSGEFEKLQQCFSSKQIEFFTKKILKPYTKKNFYVNAGKFLEDNIYFLVNDSQIRNSIIEWYEKGKSQDEIVNKMKKEIIEESEDEENDENENNNTNERIQKIGTGKLTYKS